MSYFLYAEDDTEDIALFSEAMHHETKSDNTVYVSNGFALFEYLQQIKTNESYPCLIILDFYLPRVSGMDTLTLLRTDDFYCLIPVIIFSNKMSKADTEKCKGLGAEIVSKPLTHGHWQETIHHFRSYFDE